jgi:hypothetical protein
MTVQASALQSMMQDIALGLGFYVRNNWPKILIQPSFSPLCVRRLLVMGDGQTNLKRTALAGPRLYIDESMGALNYAVNDRKA